MLFRGEDMITQKKIIIPIFNYKLTIVIFDKWKELDKFLPADEMEIEANAITIHNYGASLVAVNLREEVVLLMSQSMSRMLYGDL